MSNGYVMVPRDLLERALHRGLTGFLSVAEVDGLRAALGAQHQGEPVAWKWTHENGLTLLTAKENSPFYEGKGTFTKTPLYAHADPGAVERDERAEFEAHMYREFTGVNLRKTGPLKEQYANPSHQGAWLSWQARAALERKP